MLFWPALLLILVVLLRSQTLRLSARRRTMPSVLRNRAALAAGGITMGLLTVVSWPAALDGALFWAVLAGLLVAQAVDSAERPRRTER